MSKRIIYWTRIYQPGSEAISKEVNTLHSHFRKSFVYSMTSLYNNPLSLFDFRIGRDRFVFCYLIAPLRLSISAFEKRFDISHVFGNLDNNHYIKKLSKKPIILTAITGEEINSLKELEKIDRIVVESDKRKGELIREGIGEERVRLIYPPLDLDKFDHAPPPGNGFNILFASSPMGSSYFRTRGINLLLDAAEKTEDVVFNLLWRKKASRDIEKIIKKKKLKNVNLIDRIIPDMNEIYAEHHATIAPFIGGVENKSCPNSIIESLAAGKPVLVSGDVGISDIVRENGCGVVFEPGEEKLIEAIEKLQKHYKTYQENCRKCAEKYFSNEKFISEYERLYTEL